jgi:mRNA-degrading endonuclease YafQ of YafQ-DinJ toxin-antitoxin module
MSRMDLFQTPQFKRSIKRLRKNQKADLDKAIKIILNAPEIGEQKVGDLAWVRVYKFRMVNQLALLAYEIVESDRLVLHHVGSHENFYRDLKV